MLYLTDPLDEVVLANLGRYQDHPLVSVDAADVELPEVEDSETKDEKSAEEKASEKEEVPSGFERVLSLFREALGDEVEEVRRSERLTDSPCCLVNPSGSVSTQMQKVMHLTNREFAMSKRIFEINPHAPLDPQALRFDGQSRPRQLRARMRPAALCQRPLDGRSGPGPRRHRKPGPPIHDRTRPETLPDCDVALVPSPLGGEG